jgi:hypothetical protein
MPHYRNRWCRERAQEGVAAATRYPSAVWAADPFADLRETGLFLPNWNVPMRPRTAMKPTTTP